MTARPSPRPSRWRCGVGIVGRLLVYASLAILATVAYLAFGTARIEAHAQRALRADFAALTSAATPSATTRPPATAPRSTAPTPTSTDPAPITPALAPAGTTSAPAVGSPVARLVIPAIGLDRIVVEGVGTAQLRGGPGHYPGTARPGEQGNVGIAGHRTTYGAPFGDLDRLHPSDRITLDTVDARSFTYEVLGTEIVAPNEVRVLDDQGDDRLTLTSCHPKRSARRRIVVSARLVVPDEAPASIAPVPTTSTTLPVTVAPPASSRTTLAGSSASGQATAAWWWGWFVLGAAANEARHRCRRWLRPRGRAWWTAGATGLAIVVVGATWRGAVTAADVIQWNL